MRILKYDSKYGRYYTDIHLDVWFVDPAFWSNYDKPVEGLVESRRRGAKKHIDEIYDRILIDLEEIGLLNEIPD